MAALSDIKSRIKSIAQTKQITGAMETISVAKMRKAMQRYSANRLYFERIKETICDIAAHSEDVSHRYWRAPAGGKTVFIVIASDKGMAGGYNHNVLKLAEELISGKDGSHIFTVGQMAREYFERRKMTVDAEFLHVTYNPTISDAVDITDSVLRLYDQGYAGEIRIVYTAMKGAQSMAAEEMLLLPMAGKSCFIGDAKPDAEKDDFYYKELYFDPSPEEVLERLVPHYLTGLIYGCLVQSVAAEHSSRVMAMSSATKNADEIIDRLTLSYNRLRQETVTNEMTEIVNGTGIFNED